MLNQLSVQFHTLAQNIRIVDFFDVALITVFFYLFISWVIKSASRQLIIGISVLIGLYIIAVKTEMYLTEYLVEGLLVFFAIAVIIIFQSDIRRMVEKMGKWDRLGKKSFSENDTISDIISEAAGKMAENRTGALIVLKGKEEWERHTTGGIPLNGQVTIPLLHSIFNTKAPGHDGAILINGTIIERFGTHLPLSTHLAEGYPGGTRHAAALGLSERCDALVIVVSEERGMITTVQNGRLHEIENAGQLKEIISGYWTKHYQSQSTSPLSWWKQRNWRIGGASIVIAVLLWFAFGYQSGTISRNFSVPIEYRNLKSSDISLQDSLPSNAQLTLTGSEQAFNTFNQNRLIISFDMEDQANKETFLVIKEQNVNLPNGIHLFKASPDSLPIRQKKGKK